ncbi:hypothetical protein [Mycolicibacterium obuense]|uniref:Uncharacterized protein n=1 Tax=Mycolicibacterium obuense TaxID=1807 RepID=A0A0J6VE07_9MYCO|nr:hypothetical protein [Mycolicibacterium obuense]KMO69220.1 hypothetical protein MOBUDSM44075_04645 [Mycolicibacterium obuense]
MTTNTIVLIIVVVAIALLVIGAVAWVARDKRDKSRRAEAQRIRGQARDEKRHVTQREAHAEETAAKARAAQAEADIKAAQAKGLQQEAADHHRAASTSRDELRGHLERANDLDPDSPTAADGPASRVPRT